MKFKEESATVVLTDDTVTKDDKGLLGLRQEARIQRGDDSRT